MRQIFVLLLAGTLKAQETVTFEHAYPRSPAQDLAVWGMIGLIVGFVAVYFLRKKRTRTPPSIRPN